VKFWLLTPTQNQVLRLAILKKKKKERKKQQQQASAEVGGLAAASGGLPTWGPPQGRNTNIHPFVGPAKGAKKSEAPHIKTARHCLCCCCFLQKFFISFW